MTRSSRAYYSANPQLIPMMNGVAQGFKGVGDALVSLGDDKVKAAKEEALKTELKAKEAALQNAQAVQTSIQNPEQARKVRELYNIAEDSALASPTAPTKANEMLGLIKFDKAEKPDYSNFKTVGSSVFDAKTGKEVYTAPKDPNAVSYKDKIVDVYNDEYNNRTVLYGDGRKSIVGKAKDYQQRASTKLPDGLVSADTLEPDVKRYFLDNNLVKTIDKKWYVNEQDLKDLKPKLLGDFRVEVE